MDEVLVTGERPGPGLWRVSAGGHEVWVLPTLEPLPKNMVWRSAEVEARIAASQAVVSAPHVETNIGLLRGLTLFPSMFRARKNPGGLKLEQAVPHDVYMRWLALRVKYLSSSGDGDEELRPLVAALDLYLHAIDASGLTSDDAVWATVTQLARRHRVPVVSVTVKLTIDDPKATIHQMADIAPAAEIACLEQTLGELDSGLKDMRLRANHWSLGDIAALRAAHYPDEKLACLDAFYSVPSLHKQFEDARAQVDAAWLGAVDTALARNQSSVALLPLKEFLEPGGALDKLRARGYAVQEP